MKYTFSFLWYYFVYIINFFHIKEAIWLRNGRVLYLTWYTYKKSLSNPWEDVKITKGFYVYPLSKIGWYSLNNEMKGYSYIDEIKKFEGETILSVLKSIFVKI